MRRLASLVAVAGVFILALLVGGTTIDVWRDLNLPEYAVDPVPIPRIPKASAAGPKAQLAAHRQPSTAVRGRWARSANALCRSFSARAARIRPPRTAAGLVRVLREGAALNAEFNASIADLDPPRGREGLVRRLVGLFAADERLVASLTLQLEKGDAGPLGATVNRMYGIAAREGRIMRALGATECRATPSTVALGT